MKVIIVIISAIIGTIRFLIPGHELSWVGTYEAFAHIWVGMLIALIIWPPDFSISKYASRMFTGWTLFVITAIETIAFLMR